MHTQAFTIIIQLIDTSAGLVVDVELIVGAAAKGFDSQNPGAALWALLPAAHTAHACTHAQTASAV